MSRLLGAGGAGAGQQSLADVKFTSAHKNVSISPNCAVATKQKVCGPALPKAAICEKYVMNFGVHYAEFEAVGAVGEVGGRLAGVTAPGFDISGGACPTGSSVGWGMDTWVGNCKLRHGGKETDWHGRETWVSGETLGLKLDLGAGTLDVFLNGRSLGVIARGLAGPLCWHVEVTRAGDAMGIQGKSPPQ